MHSMPIMQIAIYPFFGLNNNYFDGISSEEMYALLVSITILRVPMVRPLLLCVIVSSSFLDERV